MKDIHDRNHTFLIKVCLINTMEIYHFLDFAGLFSILTIWLDSMWLKAKIKGSFVHWV